MTLLTSCALLTAQIPIDETSAQSTIKVKKKERKDPPPVEQQPPPVRPPAALPQVASPPPPRVDATSLAPVQTIETERGGRTKIIPWVTLAGSAVATGVGIFFAVRTGQKLDQQADLEFMINTSKSRVNIPEAFTDNQRAVFINGIAATVLISAGISGAIASSVALTME